MLDLSCYTQNYDPITLKRRLLGGKMERLKLCVIDGRKLG